MDPTNHPNEKEPPLMAKNEGNIEVHVERAGKEGSPVRRVAVDISGGCSVEVASRDGIVAVRLSTAENGVCLQTDGPQSELARAINLLRLHLPRCRA
jgi:hypothetical protein